MHDYKYPLPVLLKVTTLHISLHCMILCKSLVLSFDLIFQGFTVRWKSNVPGRKKINYNDI